MKRLFIVLVFPAVFLFLFCTPQDAFSQQNQVIAIGVSSMITPVDTVRYYQDIIDYIGEQIQRPVRMVHRRTYEEMDSLLEKGEVKVAFICSASYVKNRGSFGVELLAGPVVKGKASYHSYIIVHKDSPVSSFSELKGKVFAFTDPKSNTGTLYPAYLLKTMDTAPDVFFRKHLYSYSHNKSIELVAKKIADGAAVDSLVYEYMVQRGSPYVQQTRVVKRSPPYGVPPVVATRDLDPSLREKIRIAFLNMHRTERGQAILSAMMIDGFVQLEDSAYSSIRKMEGAVSGSSPARRTAKNRQAILFGVTPRDNPRILYEKYQPLLDYLAEETPYTYELVLKRDYNEVVSALGSGEIDMALLSPLSYLRARAHYGARCILRPKGVDGSATYRAVIIRKKENPLRRLEDLKGKKVAFAAAQSTSGNLMARSLLASAGVHLKDLDSYANFDYHDSVVKAVLKGQYDAGAVRDAVANKYGKLGVEKVAESDPLPVGPLVVNSSLPSEKVEKIQRALLLLDPRDSRHQQTIKRLDDDLKGGFMEASESEYEEIRVKINSVPQTCGRSCHPKVRL